MHQRFPIPPPSIDAVATKIDDAVFVHRLRLYADAEKHLKIGFREETAREDVDLLVAILRSDLVSRAPRRSCSGARP